MPELNNIQTYIKFNGIEIKSTIEKISKVLARIGILNPNIENQLKSIEWIVEDNRFAHLSNSEFEFYETTFSQIKICPSLLAWKSGIDKTLKNNWISFDLKIKTETIEDYNYGNRIYKNFTFSFIKKITKEIAAEFNQTGIYFTNEAQDGLDFDGIRENNRNKLWNFDYALIPKKMKQLYKEKPINYRVNENENWFECWNLGKWK